MLWNVIGNEMYSSHSQDVVTNVIDTLQAQTEKIYSTY